MEDQWKHNRRQIGQMTAAIYWPAIRSSDAGLARALLRQGYGGRHPSLEPLAVTRAKDGANGRD
jgi:hypothetical protein